MGLSSTDGFNHLFPNAGVAGKLKQVISTNNWSHSSFKTNLSVPGTFFCAPCGCLIITNAHSVAGSKPILHEQIDYFLLTIPETNYLLLSAPSLHDAIKWDCGSWSCIEVPFILWEQEDLILLDSLSFLQELIAPETVGLMCPILCCNSTAS